MNCQLDQTEDRPPVFRYVVAMILSGTIGLFVTESHQSPANIVFFRCLFAALSLSIYCFFTGKFRDTKFSGRTLLLTILGGVCIVYNWVLFFSAFQLTSITVTTVVYHVQPFMVAVLGWMFLKEALDRSKMIWMCIAFVGIIFVAGPTLGDVQADAPYLLGIGCTIAAALLYAIATIIAKSLRGIRPHLIVVVQMFVGTIVVLPLASFAQFSPVPKEWMALLALGTLNTCVMYVLIYSAFHKLNTQTIAVLTFVYPAVALLSDVVFYGNRPSVSELVGIALILTANLASAQKWTLSGMSAGVVKYVGRGRTDGPSKNAQRRRFEDMRIVSWLSQCKLVRLHNDRKRPTTSSRWESR